MKRLRKRANRFRTPRPQADGPCLAVLAVCTGDSCFNPEHLVAVTAPRGVALDTCTAMKVHEQAVAGAEDVRTWAADQGFTEEEQPGYWRAGYFFVEEDLVPQHGGRQDAGPYLPPETPEAQDAAWAFLVKAFGSEEAIPIPHRRAAMLAEMAPDLTQRRVVYPDGSTATHFREAADAGTRDAGW